MHSITGLKNSLLSTVNLFLSRQNLTFRIVLHQERTCLQLIARGKLFKRNFIHLCQNISVVAKSRFWMWQCEKTKPLITASLDLRTVLTPGD